ncbi:hypothetical protein ELQ35_03685 [Peribacillus cavernae]|uniref:Uncharacterized protein n=1 Tax=Peribacillus cavernae TaxID=1674310 RepID=A0A3S0W2W4_9BACI|nr:hypothetical protein [Peribacillus cavernae]MDQ0218461.1 hypothetical protein [Peribacillus cavernae]RUQ31460.1 hypothetical protein ELQ35_03685 [Peribacillus cavernae]
MVDVNMKVQPSFFDKECAIVFSFYFDAAVGEVGEAVVYTCEEKNPVTLQGGNSLNKEKIAFVKEFSIVKEYQDVSLKKIKEFLNVIGIKKCITQTMHLDNLMN